MKRLTLYPDPKTDSELWMEIAFQHGVDLGRAAGRSEGIDAAQAQMRDAYAYTQEAMGIKEELGA